MERSDEASPAREALQALTLKKKSSNFFDSLRALGQKGALSVKAGLDSIRGEPTKQELKPERAAESPIQPLSETPRQSIDSDGETTPKAFRKAHNSTFTPKSAMNSLRQHLRSRSIKHKRASLDNIIHTSASGLADPTGPEQFSAESNHTHDASPLTRVKSHDRRSIVATTLVGSIRGLGRMASQKQNRAPAECSPTPKMPAQDLALRSSPIDIPTSAPALTLDFGPLGFMSDSDDTSLRRERSNSLMKLTDPENITTGVPVVHRVYLPDDFESRVQEDQRTRRSVTSSDLLQIPVPEIARDPPEPPSTPMPGTNLPLEVDGASDDGPNVFERSVESPASSNTGGRDRLQRMSSLTAMAEAAALSHWIDDAADSQHQVGSDPFVVADEAHEVPDSPPGTATPAVAEATNKSTSSGLIIPGHATPLRVRSAQAQRGSSMTTILSCPSDMSGIYRVKSPLPAIAPSSEGEAPSETRPDVEQLEELSMPSPTRTMELSPLLSETSSVTERSADVPETVGRHEATLTSWMLMQELFALAHLDTAIDRPMAEASSSHAYSTRARDTCVTGVSELLNGYDCSDNDSISGDKVPDVLETLVKGALRMESVSRMTQSDRDGQGKEPDGSHGTIHHPHTWAQPSTDLPNPIGGPPKQPDNPRAIFRSLGACIDSLGPSTLFVATDEGHNGVQPATMPTEELPSKCTEASTSENSPFEAAMQVPTEADNEAASSTTDYNDFKTQQIFGCNEASVFPEYTSPYGSSDDDLLFPRSYQGIPHDHCEHRRQASFYSPTEAEHKFWQFNVKCWLGEEDEEEIKDTVSPLDQYSTDMSVDGPSSGSSLMGSPTDFALRQSDRNTRYNALHTTVSAMDSVMDLSREPKAATTSPPMSNSSPESNRNSVLALACSPSPPDSQNQSPVEGSAKQGKPCDHEPVSWANVDFKTSPARYRKRRSFYAQGSPSP